MLKPNDLAPILAELDLPPAMAIAPLEGGSGKVFRIDLEDGTALVLKDFGEKKTLPRHDAYAASLLAGLDVPVTRYLLVDESRSRLPCRFALTKYLAGSPATEFASHPSYGDLFRQIGALSRKLHAVPIPAFGTFPLPAYKHNAEYVRALADDAFGRFRHFGADPTLTQKLCSIFDRDFGTVVPMTTHAVFAHDDLHPGNILAVPTEKGLSISGLIDFGNARASAAVMDLAKTIFICEHDAPGSGLAILGGYGAIDHPAPEAALAFYTLLHRVIMWWWLRHIGVLATADAESDLIAALTATAANG